MIRDWLFKIPFVKATFSKKLQMTTCIYISVLVKVLKMKLRIPTPENSPKKEDKTGGQFFFSLENSVQEKCHQIATL